MLLEAAAAAALPAGGALAVDRELFARLVTDKIQNHPNIQIVREEIKEIPDTPTIIASGPLTSPAFPKSIAKLSGEEHLFFFDAIAPVIHADSINMEIAFRASRYGTGEQEEGDYINCPFTKEEYYAFVESCSAPSGSNCIPLKKRSKVASKPVIFLRAACRSRSSPNAGLDSLAFGPMRPVGLRRSADRQTSVCGCATAAG